MVRGTLALERSKALSCWFSRNMYHVVLPLSPFNNPTVTFITMYFLIKIFYNFTLFFTFVFIIILSYIKPCMDLQAKRNRNSVLNIVRATCADPLMIRLFDEHTGNIM